MKILATIANPDFERYLKNLQNLALKPPQVLLIEGGGEEQRLDMALYWAMTTSCPTAVQMQSQNTPWPPCLKCETCRQIAANENIDLLIFDGRISNRMDEEKPGPIRALSMDNMRELKAVLGVNPHGAGKRTVIFQGMSSLREEALNSLLKTLEEPCSHTHFILLAPQREQILPTLVSRSFCMTLPWPDCTTNDDNLAEWENTLAAFLGGSGELLDKISGKGAVDAALAGRIILACQKTLIRIMSGQTPNSSPLDRALQPLATGDSAFITLSHWFNEAQEMLAGGVNPIHVLDAFCTRLYMLIRRK